MRKFKSKNYVATYGFAKHLRRELKYSHGKWTLKKVYAEGAMV